MASGKIEQIGEPESCCVFHTYSASGLAKEHRETDAVSNHKNGFEKIFKHLAKESAFSKIQSPHVIGHRVVHGGETFKSPILIDDSVIDGIRQTIPLAPLHNPSNLIGIEVAHRFFPSLPQVAIFDTAFFKDLPRYAYQYALPRQTSQVHKIRRYGFHGISYQYVTQKTADYLKKPLESLKLIILHLGNGTSAAAINNGVCIDTSMGMTPLEGLIMGTRCGDIDPSVPIYLARTLKMRPNEIEQLLNNESGLKGLCGVKDMRNVRELANSGDENAQLAIEMYCYRIAKYIGAYSVALDGFDALVFTGGVGEHESQIRKSVCERISTLGVVLEGKKNMATTEATSIISKDSSKTKVLVVPTNEELEIARQALAVIKLGKTPLS